MPNNSNINPIAISDVYSSREEACAGLKRFWSFMKKEYCQTKVRISECEATDGKRYSYQIVFSERESLISNIAYQKRELKNALRRVEENYDAPIKSEH